MSPWKKLKEFYNESAENRTGCIVFLGFVIIPAIGLAILFIVAEVFWIN